MTKNILAYFSLGQVCTTESSQTRGSQANYMYAVLHNKT